MFSPDQLLQKTATLFPPFVGASLQIIDEGGSDRQFYRLQSLLGKTLILVHYNPDKAENRHYAEHAHFLNSHAIHVPQVIHHDLKDHLLWLQDLGTKNLWSQRQESWNIRRSLYESVLVDVASLHRIPLEATQEAGITLQQSFDETLYQWEQRYFLDHALGDLFHVDPQIREKLASSTQLAQLAQNLATLPRQLIHRDLQSQNIILIENQAWLIDFQGMRAGLPPYDLASLLCDPYVSMVAAEREELLHFYEQEMKRHHFSFPYDFKKVFWQCATQRLMQALGAYGFLTHHRQKDKFQHYVTPALLQLHEALRHLHPEDQLHELKDILSPLTQ